MNLLVRCAVMMLVLVFSTPAFGQWMTQTITLRPGWNAVFLGVQPEPSECGAVFEGMPIESVWAWNKRFTSVQFIQDTSTLVPEQPEWLKYFPTDKSNAFATDLFTIQGGCAYLIHVGGSEPVQWNIKGKPVSRAIHWMSNSFNLVGFHVHPNTPPAFEGFFAPSPAHAGKPIYRMNASGHWEVIPATESIQPGEAYWVYCDGPSNYAGPLRIAREQERGVDFGRILQEQTLRIKNETSSVKQITLSKKTSESPPQGDFPGLAGDVLLSYWKTDLLENDLLALEWADLPAQLPLTIAPGEELALRLAVKRKDMPGSPDALYQSLLEISDNAGTQLFLPVTSEGMIAYQPPASLRLRADETAPHERAGLWVGTAVIDKVSHASGSDPTAPQPTASEFQFRLIIHVDASGQAKLLQQATLMWNQGVEEPGRFVIVTKEDLLSQFSGAVVRDGKPIGRRVSSAAFTSPEPIAMTGSVDNTLTCTVTLGYDDPLNPFKHKYHPDHDNLDYYFDKQLAEGTESYTIARTIALDFTADDPEGRALPGWGDNQIGGAYRENIQGVHKQELHVAGIFRLHHVSRVPVLNDGL